MAAKNKYGPPAAAMNAIHIQQNERRAEERKKNELSVSQWITHINIIKERNEEENHCSFLIIFIFKRRRRKTEMND